MVVPGAWNQRGGAGRAGLTLVEIAISIGLVATALLTIMLTVPAGMRMQTEVRYKVIAAAKAMELLELMRTQTPGMVNDARDMDKEGIFPWDTRTTYKSMAPDMESYIENLRGSVRPLPETIARRLDSDNDEIQDLLDAGGRLYYFFPNEPVEVLESTQRFVQDEEWLPASRRLLVGVVGYPQHNSVLYHPSIKLGPYQDFYPSPPSHGREQNTDQARSSYKDGRSADQLFNYDALTRDGDLAEVMQSTGYFNEDFFFHYNNGGIVTRQENASGQTPLWPNSVGNDEERLGYLPFVRTIIGYQAENQSLDLTFRTDPVDAATNYAGRTARRPGTPPTSTNIGDAGYFGDKPFEEAKRRACAYLVVALWYLKKKMAASSTSPQPQIDGAGHVNVLFNVDTRAEAVTFAENLSGADDWPLVLGMRHVAHAAAILTAYHPFGLPGAGIRLDGDQAVVVPDEGGTDAAGNNLMDLGFSRDSVTINPSSLPRLTTAHIQAWHEAAVQMAVRHADQAGPYHWGAPRPLNRQVMMDHPLVQLDPWSRPITASFEFTASAGVTYPYHFSDSMGSHWPPYSDTTVNASYPVTRRQWRAVYPEAIQEAGIPRMYTGQWRDQDGDGIVDPRDGSDSEAYPMRLLDCGQDGPDAEFAAPGSSENGGDAYEIGGSSNLGLDEDDYNVPADPGDPDYPDWQPALGPHGHFNLVAPFSPQERCRQLVFWAVDWQNYEDFETTASAAIDASRYPLPAPHARKDSGDDAWSADNVQRTDYQRMLNAQGAVPLTANSLRNPELVSVFRVPTLIDEVTGAGDFAGSPRVDGIPIVGEIQGFKRYDESDYFLADHAPRTPDMLDGDPQGIGSWTGSVDNSESEADTSALLGHDIALWNPMVFLGKYGANRDGEITNWAASTSIAADNADFPGRGKPEAEIGGGSLPSTVRLRAVTVARFNFYDPRVSGSLRQ